MFGKQSPDKPGYEHGSIMHFFEYAVEQCEICSKNNKIKTNKYKEILFFPIKDRGGGTRNSYTVCYSPIGWGEKGFVYTGNFKDYCEYLKQVVLYETEILADGSTRRLDDLYSLTYNKKENKFNKFSHLGPYNANDMLEGKHSGLVVPEAVYAGIEASVIYPLLATSLIGEKEAFIKVSKKLNKD